MTDTLESIALEIKSIADKLAEDYSETDPYTLMHLIKHYTGYLARTNTLYANAEYLLNTAKGKASEAIDAKVGATRYKDVLMMKCAREQKVFRFVERTNAAIVHILEALRSQLSYVKEEIKMTGGQNG